MSAFHIIREMAIPRSVTLNEAAFAPDEHAVAYVGHCADHFLVRWLDGRITESQRVDSFVLAKSGEVSCKLTTDGSSCIARNGVFGPRYAWIDFPRLSASGGHIGYWGMQYRSPTMPDDVDVVIETQDGPKNVAPLLRDLSRPQQYWIQYDDMSFGPFSAHGALLLRPAGGFIGSCRDQQVDLIVLDGTVRLPFERVGPIAVCPKDGAAWYWGLSNGRWALWRETEIVDRADDCNELCRPAWDSTGTHCSYWRIEKSNWRLIVNGNEATKADFAVEVVGAPVISATGVVAAAMVVDSRPRIYAGGGAGRAFDAVGRPVVSDAARAFAYKARQGEREVLVLNGAGVFDLAAAEPGPEMPNILLAQPSIALDGSAATCTFQHGRREILVLNECVIAEADMITQGPTFLPRRHDVFYCTANRRRETIHLGESRAGPFDQVWCSGEMVDDHLSRRPQGPNVKGQYVLGASLDRDLFRVTFESTG